MIVPGTLVALIVIGNVIAMVGIVARLAGVRKDRAAVLINVSHLVRAVLRILAAIAVLLLIQVPEQHELLVNIIAALLLATSLSDGLTHWRVEMLMAKEGRP